MKKKKVVITDIDGCILRWHSKLLEFIQSRKHPIHPDILECVENNSYYNFSKLDPYFNGNFIEAYHSSEFGSTLDPIDPDMLKILEVISKKYLIISLTAFTNIDSTKENRKKNLQNHFPDLFYDHVMVSPIDSKEFALAELNKKYDIQMYVDDRQKHIDEALKVLKPNKIHHLQNFSEWHDILAKI